MRLLAVKAVREMDRRRGEPGEATMEEDGDAGHASETEAAATAGPPAKRTANVFYVNGIDFKKKGRF